MVIKYLYFLTIVIGALTVWLAIDLAPSMRSFIKLRIIEKTEDITYYLGNGGNSGLIIGENEAVLIDTKFGGFSKKLKKKIEEKVGSKKLSIINTHYHTDHTGGNYLYTQGHILAGDYGKDFWLLENDVESLPTTWVKRDTSFDLGGLSVRLIPIGANHTKNDLFIYIPEHKLLFTGDVYSHQTHPVIKADSEPNIFNWEQTLRAFSENDLIIEEVIPGHGSLASKNDLQIASDYFCDLAKLSKIEVKKKYKRWYKLPFLATTGRNWKYVQELAKVEP